MEPVNRLSLNSVVSSNASESSNPNELTDKEVQAELDAMSRRIAELSNRRLLSKETAEKIASVQKQVQMVKTTIAGDTPNQTPITPCATETLLSIYAAWKPEEIISTDDARFYGPYRFKEQELKSFIAWSKQREKEKALEEKNRRYWIQISNAIVEWKYIQSTTPAEREQNKLIEELTHHQGDDGWFPEDPNRGSVNDEEAGRLALREMFQAMEPNELKAIHSSLKRIFSATLFRNNERPIIVRGFLHAAQANKCITIQQKKEVWAGLVQQIFAVVGGNRTNSHDLTWTLEVLRSTFEFKNKEFRDLLVNTALQHYNFKMSSVARVYILSGLHFHITDLSRKLKKLGINTLDLKSKLLKAYAAADNNGKQVFVKCLVPASVLTEEG